MKRVICIVGSLNAGGAETFLIKLFRKLPSDYKMDFIVSVEGGYYESEVEGLGGRIFHIPLRTEAPTKALKEIKRIVKENGYKSVLKLCDTPIGYLDLLMAKKGGATLLCARSCNASSPDKGIRNIVNKLLQPAFNRITDVKIAPSDLAAKYTFGQKQVEKGNVSFLNNAVDLEIFRYDIVARDKVRHELDIENKLVIGHIGRFSNQKNHTFLIEIFSKIKLERNDAVLVLVGKGNLEADIRMKVKDLGLDDSVIFTGIRSDVPALLSAMDVFVFPSFYEGMPNTVIEAQATGLPCVIADTITREADITGIVKYLSLSDSSEIWADTALASVSEKRVDTRQNFIENNYDIDSTVKRFTELVFVPEK